MILLDTHALLWFAAGSSRLNCRAREILQLAWGRGAVAVSVFTYWEIALLQSKGRLRLKIPPRPLYRRMRVDGLKAIPVSVDIAFRAAELADEGFHADPADRIIAATALVGGYQLATADEKILDWAGRTRKVSTLALFD